MSSSLPFFQTASMSEVGKTAGTLLRGWPTGPSASRGGSRPQPGTAIGPVNRPESVMGPASQPELNIAGEAGARWVKGPWPHTEMGTHGACGAGAGLNAPHPLRRNRRVSPGAVWMVLALLFLLFLPVAPVRGQEGEIPTLTPDRVFSAEGFSRVRGVQKLPDGRVLVADQTEEALYRVDFQCQERTMLGSRGQGPGEYRGPTGLHPFRGDSLLRVDIQNGRFAIVSPDGVIGRTEPLFGRDITVPEGSDQRGNRYWDEVTALRIQKRTNLSADTAPIIRYDPAKEGFDTLAYLTIPGPRNPNAFPAWDDWAVGPGGRVAIVRNQGEYRLDWVIPDGTILQGTPVQDYRPLRVTNNDERAVQEGRGGASRGASRMGSQPTRRPPTVDIPGKFPPAKLGRIWVTWDGRAIVERHQHLDEQKPLFDLFDDAGRRIRSFRLPEARQIVGTGPSGIFVVREDEVGLLWLEQYSLPER